MTKTKSARTNSPTGVPQTRDDMIEAISQIGEKRRELARIAANMNDELAAVKARHEEAADPIRDELKTLEQGAQMYAEANRDSLTNMGKSKTVEFPSGKVNWKTKPPSVAVRGMAKVIEQVQRLQLGMFLREKTELDKEAMLKDPERATAIDGVTIKSGEETFSIEPYEADLNSGEA